MKTTVTTLTVCISLMLIGIFTLQSSAKMNPKNIVGEWHFDEGSGKTVKDSSSNGNDGELMNDPKWVEGKAGKALEFDGKDDFVDMSDVTLDSSAITITAWAKQFPGSGHIAVAYGGGDVAGSFILRVRETYVGIWASGWANAANSPQEAISTDEWVHVAATADGSEFKIYINGVLKGEGSQAGYQVAKTKNFMVGRTKNRDYYFNGIIDEVALFNVALIEADVRSVMAAAAVSPAGKLAISWGAIKAH